MFHAHHYLSPAGRILITVFVGVYVPLALSVGGWCIYKALRRTR